MTISGIQNGYLSDPGGRQHAIAARRTLRNRTRHRRGLAELCRDRQRSRPRDRRCSRSLRSISNYEQRHAIPWACGSRARKTRSARSNIATISFTMRALNSQFTLNQNGQTDRPDRRANGQLGEIIDALNTQVGDVYIFSGTAAEYARRRFGRPDPQRQRRTGGAEADHRRARPGRSRQPTGWAALSSRHPPLRRPQIDRIGATLTPDAIASVAGAAGHFGPVVDAAARSSSTATPVTINPGDNAAAILSDINGESATTGVSASLDQGNHLVLQSANAATASQYRRRQFGLGAGRAWPFGRRHQPDQSSHPGRGRERADADAHGRRQSAADRYVRHRRREVSTLHGLETALAGPCWRHREPSIPRPATSRSPRSTAPTRSPSAAPRSLGSFRSCGGHHRAHRRHPRVAQRGCCRLGVRAEARERFLDADRRECRRPGRLAARADGRPCDQSQAGRHADVSISTCRTAPASS